MFLDIPIWAIGAIIAALMIVAAEIGYQIGLRTPTCDSGVGAVKASVLALVGLLLAFSYSIAAGHFDGRLQAGIGEAKSLKTCWLRMDLADGPAQSRGRELLRSIVDARLASLQSDTSREEARQSNNTIFSCQQELWKIATDQLRQSQEPEKHVLLSLAVNDVIDRGSERNAAYEIRVPAPVMYLLIASILASGFLIGLSSGRDKHRIPLLLSIMIVLMVVVLTMIFDLDNPGHGMIAEWDMPLEDVKSFFEKSSG